MAQSGSLHGYSRTFVLDSMNSHNVSLINVSPKMIYSCSRLVLVYKFIVNTFVAYMLGD